MDNTGPKKRIESNKTSVSIDLCLSEAVKQLKSMGRYVPGKIESLGQQIAIHSEKIAIGMIKNSPDIIHRVDYDGLEKISALGMDIIRHSGKTALEIFEKSPDLLNRLSKHGDKVLALSVYGLSHQLAKYSWRTAAGMLDMSPEIIDRIGFKGLEKITQIGLRIAPHSWLTALSNFEKSPRLIDRLLTYGKEDFVMKVYNAIGHISQYNWQIAVFLLDSSPDLIHRIGYDGLEKVAQFGNKIALKNWLSAVGMLEKCQGHIDEMLTHGDSQLVMDVFDCCIQTADQCWQTSLCLFERSPDLVGFMGYPGFCQVAEKACELAAIKPERAISFIKGESAESAEFMDGISDNLKLRSVKPILTHYLNALLSYRIEIAPSSDHSTDGSTIFLPENICEFDDKEKNFMVYKVYATHEEAHLEYGSYDFRLSEIQDVVDDIKAKYGDTE